MPESALAVVVISPAVVLATLTIMSDTIRLIVDSPDQIDIKTQSNGRMVTLVLSVAPDDIGKVIGKQGRTARSLRTVLSAISSKTGVSFNLDIQVEPA